MATITKRISQNGESTFQVKVRLKGFPSQTATFERLTDAKKWASSTESAIREGRHFEVSEARKRTLSNLIDKYLSDEATRLRSKETRLVHLEWWRSKLGAYTLSDIRPALLIEARKSLFDKPTRRGSPVSPSTVNRYCASLSAVFTWAMKELQWVSDNPFFKISTFKEPEGVVRFLSNDERTALLKACRGHSQDLLCIVVLALSTGARRNEILSLTWDSIDLSQGLLTFPKTKNGTIRHVPIRGNALSLIKEIAAERKLKDAKGLVFSGKTEHTQDKPKAIENIFKTALKQAGIENFRFHDLRHSAASELVMAGVDMRTVAEILGHSDLKITQRYAHLSRAHVDDAVSRLNDRLFGGAG